MWLLLTLTFFLLVVGGHALLCRSRLALDFVGKAIVAGAPIGCLLVVCLLVTSGTDIKTAAGTLLYAFLCELYIFSFTLVSASVSVSLLLKLSRGVLSSSEMDGIYTNTAMVQGRFNRLLRAGLLVQRGGNYLLTPKARMLVRGFRTIRFFFYHSKWMEKTVP
jgi:hypothetical protein